MKTCGVLACVSLLAAGLAQSEVQAQSGEGEAQEGSEIFATFCATCHGFDATGNGPMAEIVAVETPDLTTLAARNGGSFPFATVAIQIDGRDPVLAHGGMMPIFGQYFEGNDVMMQMPSGQTMATSQPIADLLTWLDSIQTE